MTLADPSAPAAVAPRLCLDCRFVVPRNDAFSRAEMFRNARCRRAWYIDLVTGEESYSDCRGERTPFGACGPDGNRFEPRDGR